MQITAFGSREFYRPSLLIRASKKTGQSVYAPMAKHLCRRLVLPRAQTRRFVEQRRLPGGGHEILFFIPPGFASELGFHFTGQSGNKRLRHFATRGANFYLNRTYQVSEALSRLMKKAGGSFPETYATAVFKPITISESEGSSSLHSILVGLQFGPAVSYTTPDPKVVELGICHLELHQRLEDFHNRLVEGFFTAIARRFGSDLSSAAEKIETSLLEKIEGGHRIFLYIPFKKLHPRLRKLYQDEIQGITPPKKKKRGISTDGKLGIIIHDSETTLIDNETGKEISVPYAKRQLEQTFYNSLHDLFGDLFETSINNYIHENRDLLPAFIPIPRLDIQLEYQDPTSDDQTLAGVGIGILFLNRFFGEQERRSLSADTVIFTRERKILQRAF